MRFACVKHPAPAKRDVRKKARAPVSLIAELSAFQAYMRSVPDMAEGEDRPVPFSNRS